MDRVKKKPHRLPAAALPASSVLQAQLVRIIPMTFVIRRRADVIALGFV
jgi:hypothetical protein